MARSIRIVSTKYRIVEVNFSPAAKKEAGKGWYLGMWLSSDESPRVSRELYATRAEAEAAWYARSVHWDRPKRTA